VSRTLQPGLQEGDDHRSGRRDWGHSPKSQIVVHVLLKFVLGRVALLLFRNDERCRHGRSEEAPGPALGLGPGAAGAPIAGAGPAIGGRRGRIPAAAGGCGGLPPGAPTPGGGIPGVACAGACGAGGVENGFVPPTRLLRPIIANLHRTGRWQHLVPGIRPEQRARFEQQRMADRRHAFPRRRG
jgi:hypothetical protein